ncbi:interleukin-10 receptor subunit alpha isoform X1 [Macrotis lagotis]|uniref:interleukin-10 receptor subunit alpha isoform X1 n=1 Tax=Macrotis lagotis TaxID=92651 RepID=UPI003D6959B9
MMLPWLVAWTPALLLLCCRRSLGAAASGVTACPTSVPGPPDSSSPSETQLPSPRNVQFTAILFNHTLHWDPGQNQNLDPNISYEVQYMRYSQGSWCVAPNCFRTPRLFCDLTLPTLNLYSETYFARVRAVAGDQKSNWTRTDTRLTKDDVILWIDQVKLQLIGNTLLVEILPARPPKVNGNLSYEHLFKYFREYEINVTKTLENQKIIQESQKEDKEIFNLAVSEARQVCIRVKPIIRSQNNMGRWSDKECITITKPFITVTTICVFFASLLMVFLVAVYLRIQFYIRKPKKPPEVLASLAKQKYSGILSKESFKVKHDVIHHLDEASFPKVSPELKNSELHSSTDSGFSSTKQSLQSEDPQFLLPVLDSSAGGTPGESGPQQSKNNLNTGSEDSGIYLHTLNPQSGQEWKQPGRGNQHQEDSGLSQSSTAASLGSSQGLQYKRVSTALEGSSSNPKLCEEEAGASVVFQGYLQQSRCPEQNQEGSASLGEASSPTDSPGYKCRAHRDVESTWPPVTQTKGYLKQSSPGQSLGVPGASPRQWIKPTEEWSLLSLVNCSSDLTSEWSNPIDHPLLNFPKAPTPSGILHTDLITLPLISSVHTNE